MAFGQNDMRNKYANNGNMVNYRAAGDAVVANSNPNEAAPATVAFETTVDGKAYQFESVKGIGEGTTPFADYAEFYQQVAGQATVLPSQGDMVASSDGYLYAYAGPTTKAEDGTAPGIGWYRSTAAFHGQPAGASK